MPVCPYQHYLIEHFLLGIFPSNNQNKKSIIDCLPGACYTAEEGYARCTLGIVSRNLFELRWEDSVYIKDQLYKKIEKKPAVLRRQEGTGGLAQQA